MVPSPTLSRIVQRSNTFTARFIAARYGLAGPSSEQTKHSSQQPNASHLDVYNQDADPVRPHTRVFSQGTRSDLSIPSYRLSRDSSFPLLNRLPFLVKASASGP